jgi:hypothetical protein
MVGQPDIIPVRDSPRWSTSGLPVMREKSIKPVDFARCVVLLVPPEIIEDTNGVAIKTGEKLYTRAASRGASP